MRISDWSSDVCSSDLPNRSANQGREAAAAPQPRWHARARGRPPDRARAWPGRAPIRALLRDEARHRARAAPRAERGPRATPPKGGADEIGRASFRERVGPHVALSVVPVSLNNKTPTHTQETNPN